MQQTGFKFFRRLTAIGIWMLLAFSITPYIPLSVTYIDLPSHFVLQYVIAAVIGICLALLFKMRRGYFLLLGFAFILNMATLAPYLDRSATVHATAPKTFKFLQVNTLYLNRRTALLESQIRAENPDIITVVEANPAFAAMFKTLADLYPYQDIHPRSDARGLAVLSKFPLQDVAVSFFDEPNTPAQTFTARIHGTSIRFVSVHPYTPIRTLDKRDTHMTAVAKAYAAPQETPLVITGDFNATPWSPAMKQFMRDTALHSAREGHGILPTWPRWLPGAFLRIPIDHVLVSDPLRVVDYRLGADTGADHLPTIAVIAVP